MENRSSTTKYLILSELARKDMHGYELITRIGQITGKKPSSGQIYPVLKQMKSAGYVTVKTKKDGRKKIKYYKMTPAGKKFFGIVSKRFEALIMAALKKKIKTCAHCGCEIYRGGYSKKISGKIIDFCCVSCAGSYKG